MLGLSSLEFKLKAKTSEPLGAVSPLVSRWSMIDYWLYLLHVVERGRTRENHFDEVHLLTANGFKPTRIDFKFLHVCRRKPGLELLIFLALPIPSIRLGLPDRKIVLGFDLKTLHLHAYLAARAPEHLANFGQVWSRAELVFSIGTGQFLDTLECTLTDDLNTLRTGILTSFTKSTRKFHSALELVIAIQFSQFLYDFTELLGKDRGRSIESHQRYNDQMRELLRKASTDAWFGAKDGLTVEQHRRREKNAIILFNSVESGKVSSSPGSNVQADWT
ncbi:hypothetical protein N7448_005908 [Penicillium atrosanguineum]|nr:hypothetical protein N7448_005908 [Penicillium atrosanguineum]KAJ5138045.1 hypothetical protein N7526_004278 [Penicillium atrosanguineum]